jgi:hypothetical protein
MRRLLLALLLPLAVPASAPAATSIPTGPVAGLALVEDGAVWIRPVGLSSWAVMGGRPGGTVRPLVRSAFNGHLVGNGSVATFTSFRGVWAGTAAEMRQVYVTPRLCSPGGADADADLMAITLFCGQNSSVMVRGPGGAERTFHGVTSDVEVAGRYVAWATGPTYAGGGTVVLYDAVADREVLRAGGLREPTGGGGPELSPIGLEPDGKLLVAVDRMRNADTAWLSPAEPELHRLGIPPLIVRAFARDRVLTMTAETENAAPYAPHGYPLVRTRVELVGLDGSRRVVASTRGVARVGGADYDGRRIALARMTCDGTRILLRSTAEPPLSLAGDDLCPLEVTGPVALTFGERTRAFDRALPRVRARVRCALTSLRFCGELIVRALDGQVLSHKTFGAGRDRTFTLMLDDAGARRLAREGSMRVRLEMRFSREDILLQRPKTVTLRVAPQDLARLRRCVRVRSRPEVSGCPA